MENIIFITGASGTGKTTLVEGLKERYKNKIDYVFLNSDSTGVPEFSEMIEKYGSTENWQKQNIDKWIDYILNNYKKNETVIFEGQSKLDYIYELFQKKNFKKYEIVLVDCNEDIMKKRLIERNQPELFDENMKNWLKYLRNQAQELKAKIIDTSNISKKEVIKSFEIILKIKK